MKKGIRYFSPVIAMAVAVCLAPSCSRHNSVTLQTLLLEMADRSAVTEYPVPEYRLMQFSSYDRRSVHPDSAGWFANDDFTRFLRADSVNGRREFVMFDDNGPGAIVRWWMTFSGDGAHEGTIRIYIDGSSDPVIESPPLPLISGGLLAPYPLSSSVSEETELLRRGHNLYLPIPYSRSCLITYECPAVTLEGSRPKPSIYYNINYRKYRSRTRVESFSNNELENNKLLIEETCSRLTAAPDGTGSSAIRRISGNLMPGDTIAIDYSSLNGAVEHISLRIFARNHGQALRSLVLSAAFDGIASVWVPAGDFFGSGHMRTNSSTFFTGSDSSGYLSSSWIMPFRKTSRVAIINYGQRDAQVELEVRYTRHRRTANTMYFGASWHEYHNILTAGSELTGGTGRHTDITFTEIAGKGVYAGDGITVFNTVDAWWGEGDEKIYVDGEEFPSSFGTGTEDYYGYAWCRPETFSHPFVAQPSGAGNFHPGQTINQRLRSLDAIPFSSGILSNIELWHWVPAVINYSLTSYYYFLAPAEVMIESKPVSAMTRVPRSLNDFLPLPPSR